MQLDIFEHSRDVMLRNAVVEALEQRNVDGSARAIGALAREYADDRLCAPASLLLEQLRSPITGTLSTDTAIGILQKIEGDVADAARTVFMRDAQAWMMPIWIDLAQAIGHFPFDPHRESLHAAPLLLRIGEWRKAAACVEKIPSWFRQSIPLAWMVEARCRMAGLTETWPLIAELAWMSPPRAQAIVLRLALTQFDLNTRIRRFDTEFEGEDTPDDFAWFPAWALIADPRLSEPLRLARSGTDTPPERTTHLVLSLLHFERQGRHAELVAGRKKLREAHASLFAFYMQSR